MSALRQLLKEISEARGGVSIDDIARKVGVSRDEADAMVDYWVRKGRLSVDDLAAGCPSGGCGGCAQGVKGKPGCGSSPGNGPVLLAITIPRRPGA
ncbi:MAG: hypothetical protein JWO67_3672 [Streptosporangiaceae bacterium]|jgi:hypothetical protein|nr:hypothetical protein [Streptosporangiaceae bacterium]